MTTVQTVYIDILICVNLIINYLILSAASFYTHTEISVKRLITGSVVGAVCSL
ncbi:MAG: sigma-E processing peptidase SpoIIGA, partial [Clostridia bacterium]|nr:sigma-E processing peptidase SpoIIGA [Clostridia bacterium]